METFGQNKPWQLELFKRSLKKQQKLRALLSIIGKVSDQNCLLITCGDNNGALNWHLKQYGGSWSWADAEKDSLEQIEQLTGDPVTKMDKDRLVLTFPDNFFDLAVTIDVHEHLKDTPKLNLELSRIVKSGGRVVVTTPNGNPGKLATRIKLLVGMRPEDYGHEVIGFDIPDLEAQMRAAGLKPFAQASYARFFTEMLELMINFTYVKVLSRRGHAKVAKGQIAPQNREQIKSVERSIKLYALFYPIFHLISRLDILDLSEHGYAVIVAARKA